MIRAFTNYALEYCLALILVFNFIVNGRGRGRVLRSAARRLNVDAASMVGVA